MHAEYITKTQVTAVSFQLCAYSCGHTSPSFIIIITIISCRLLDQKVDMLQCKLSKDIDLESVFNIFIRIYLCALFYVI